MAIVIPIKSNPDPETTLIAGRNVNMVSGTVLPEGDPYLQRQNEPSIAVSTRNPLHLLAGANDYRSIDIAMEDQLPGYEQTNAAPAPDAWLGVFKSIDGGSTWKSTLLPGFSYYDTTPLGASSSPLFGFSAAADPVVRSGPNGLFFYAGIAFNREDRGDSAVFVSRFIDNNNKENVDTTAYVDTQIRARGNSGQFIDKPWLAVDVPYQEEPSIPIDLPYLQDPYTDRQYVTRCNVYLAYSVFLGNPYKTPRTKIYFQRSTDSGTTWESPTKLTETQHINQGAVIAVDPRGNGHVYVAWRRFFHMNKKGKIIQPDAIVVVKSEDGGRRFSKPIVVAELAPWFPPSDDGVFDQATTPESFRTNDYPTMAIDHNGTAHIAWAQRGLGPDSNPGTGVGEARIVMSSSSDGDTWSTPEQVISPMEGDPPGHEFMPQLTYAAGKLTLLWYDQRWDVIQEYLPFIEDIYTNVRHTIDVRVAQAEIHSAPEFSPSTQVSKYPFILWPSETPGYFNALQLLYNKPNLPIFAHGTVPFMGDYIGIAPSPMYLPPEDPNNPTDYWIYNTDPLTPTHYHAVWTDNRDVIPPGEDNWSGVWDQYNAPGSGCSDENLTGVRNQNIYTSRISEGILAGSPGNTKPLNILRSFVVFVQNTTGIERLFTLEIEKPDDMVAYFWQEDGTKPEDIFVSVPPYSYLSKTILVGQYTPDEYASIIINIKDDEDNLVSYVTLNPDPTNPLLDQPEGVEVDPDNPHARNEGETHTPHARNYTIVEWNTELQDPYINTIYPQYDEAIANNDGVTPYPVDGQEQNPHARNPHARNPHARNPHARNNVLNPHARNENIPEDIPEGSHMTDVIRTIENTGNTTTSYSINTFPTPEDLPDGVLAQLIVFKTYTTPTVDPYGDGDPNSEGSNGCELVEQEHQEVIVMKSPHARNMSELGDISVLVPPKGTFHVLYRFYNPYQSTEQQEFHDEEKFEEAVPEIESDVPDTDPDDPTQPLPEPPKLLVIPPQTLPDGIVGDTFYSTAIQVEGGTGTYGNWTIINGALPGNLSLDSNSGVISGDLLTSVIGDYTFKVEVSDFDKDGYPVQIATKTLSMRVIDPLEITTGSLPDAVLGAAYYAKLDATGGFTPYTWNLELAPPYSLPEGLSLDSSTGEITGTPTGRALYPLNFKVADSTNPIQSDTKSLSIQVLDPISITTPTLYDAFRGGSYVDILLATGGTEPYTWSVISGSPPEGLALTPGTNRIEGTVTQTAVTSTFTVQVTDSSSPILTATQEITIDVYDPPTITTSSPLPDGTAGASYSTTLSGSDGNTPYEWSVFSGALPDGLSLNTSTGEISGTPTTAGTSSFTIRLTDSSNPRQIFNKDFTLTINAMITGTVKYNGSPITDVTTTENLNFWAYKSGMAYPTNVAYDNSTGEYSIPNIQPGEYQLNLLVDAASPTDGEWMPGDFIGSQPISVPEGEEVINVDLDCSQFIHFTAPIDNLTIQGIYPPDPYDTYSSPVFFQWDPVVGATESTTYNIGVQRYQHSPDFSFIETHINTSTSNTQISVDLPVIAPNEHYQLRVMAFNDSIKVGETTIVFSNAHGSKYMFRIVPPPLASFEVDTPANGLVGAPFSMTVTAKDSGGNPTTNVSGSTSLSVDDGTISPTSIPENEFTDDGIWTGNVTISGTSGLRTVTAVNNGNSGNTTITINTSRVITGTLKYNGEPITNKTTTENVNIRLYGVSPPITPEYNNSTGQYTFLDVPPGTNYQVIAYVDAASPVDGRHFPGDYHQWSNYFSVSEEDSVITVDVNLRLKMRLIAPFDSSTTYGIAPPQGAYHTHASPVGFQWEAVPEATSYMLYVQKSTGGMAVNWITTTNTWVSLSLPESGTGDYYRFSLIAENATGAIIADTYTVFDNGFSTVYPFKAIPGFKITTTSLYDAFRNGGFVDILNANYGIEPYSWSIISGALPDGLVLTPGTNRIEGTVSASASTSTFTVQATDSGSPSQSVTKELTISVYDPPTISTSSSLPSGAEGTPYSVTLSGSGGNTPYIWSLYSGSLPPGLSLNTSTGEISGTPTNDGNYSFVIRLTDSSNPNQTYSKAFSISITSSTRTISGTVETLGTVMPGVPIPDVTIYFSGGAGTATTISDGTYSHTVPYGWSGTAYAAKAGYSFSPATRTYTNVTSNLASQDYTGTWQGDGVYFITQPTDTPVNQTISPLVRIQVVDDTGTPLPGLTVTVTIYNNPGGATPVTVTSITNTIGIATFGISIDKTGNGYTLKADATFPGFGTFTAYSIPFNIY